MMTNPRSCDINIITIIIIIIITRLVSRHNVNRTEESQAQKPHFRNHISCSKKTLKLVYSNVNFEKFPGMTPGPHALRRGEETGWKGEGTGWVWTEMEKGRRASERRVHVRAHEAGLFRVYGRSP